MNTTNLVSANRQIGESAGRAARQREVENALIVQALCERKPGPNAKAQLMRYVAGELSREQAFAELYIGMG